ncbi:radical SAM family heme chaperone HemW [Mucilaginibacter sp. RS28]|uniref:Heme chaperone HemW n=1 Tax=Mucilaginibacter straminoryzae TaxID=2932774 RepID=A0A9X1X5F8_9SPHI|nr:radical SAM family heme chaperone HemW [Mucilaginibacter straminoryzae]MCJ8210400.1 radical SAM family heme chaperone HemW [Mucilaginibacter straminoryzae]
MAGIYIHVPFCKQACYYCDFHFSTSLKYKQEMLEAIRQEIALQKDYLGQENINTIYFGGGTPSLLTAQEINTMTEQIAQHFHIAADVEFTLETNPDDLTADKVKDLRSTAVNRFSIGIQSFFDEDLKWMNRAHNAGEAESSVKRAQDAGFENITIDLIFGYPLLSDAKWKQNIQTALDLDVPHISAYGMTVEPRTALAAFIRKKKSPPLNDHQSAEQFLYLSDTLQAAGYEHYEISNYAQPDHYSRHNTNYWKGVKYLGLGPSAHSFNGEARQWNVANNAKYIEAILQNRIPAETEILTETDRLNEYVMTSLRTMWGLDLSTLEGIAAGASTDLIKTSEPFLEKGWLIREEGIFRLTREGKLYADHIASELFF